VLDDESLVADVLVALDVDDVTTAVLLVVEEDLKVAEEDFECIVLSIPTQYESLTQKLVMQSFETAGFHLRKSAWEILEAVSSEKQESPDLTMYHLLQFEAVFGCVGPEGLFSWQETTTASRSSRTLNKKIMFEATSWGSQNSGLA